jgi:hypothetical protein
MIQTADPIEECPTCVLEPRARRIPLLPLPQGVKTKPNTRQLRMRDMRTLVTFVKTYCSAKHKLRQPFGMPGLNIEEIAGKDLFLCPECAKLLQHALAKRTHCPRDPKPDCKRCPTRCYAPRYRTQMRDVMRFSGWRLLLRGRLDYLWHLLF